MSIETPLVRDVIYVIIRCMAKKESCCINFRSRRSWCSCNTDAGCNRKTVFYCNSHARIKGGDSGSGPPLKNHRNIGFLSNTDLDSLKNKLAYNVGPTFASQRNAIEKAIRWLANDDLLSVVFRSSHLIN